MVVRAEQESVRSELGATQDTIKEVEVRMMGALDKLQAEVDKLRKELSKRASDGASGMVRPSPRNVPPPKEFDGKRDAMEFEDFLWRIEKYFKATHMEDEEDKIKTATSYLTGNAIIWW